MSTNKQLWVACKYSCAAGDGDYSSMLREHGLFESYNCENPEVIKAGQHPTKPIYERDFKSFTRVAELYRVGCPRDPTKKQERKLQAAVENALAVCKDCKQHLPRNNK